jgi:hypothetical protein
MIRHMKNIRSISIRRMVSAVEALLLVLIKVALVNMINSLPFEFTLELCLSPLL